MVQILWRLLLIILIAIGFGLSAYGTYKASAAAFGTMTGVINGTKCFVAGTLVLTIDGEKPIEDIEIGDYVYASDPETGESGYKEVLQTFVNESSELVHIYVNGDEIVSTPTHPFYSPKRGWTNAVDLKAGDILVLSNGEYVVVEQVQHEILETPVKVYNFEVQDFHTYYIGKNSIFVHNMCQIKNQANTFTAGELFEEHITLDDGTDIGALAEVEIHGKKLILKDISIY